MRQWTAHISWLLERYSTMHGQVTRPYALVPLFLEMLGRFKEGGTILTISKQVSLVRGVSNHARSHPQYNQTRAPRSDHAPGRRTCPDTRHSLHVSDAS